MSPGKRKRSPSPPRRDIERAVNSLLQWRNTIGYQMYPSVDLQNPFLYLIFYFKNIPYYNNHLINNPGPIRLPNSILPQSPKLGLIINDTTTDDEELNIKHEAHEKIQSLNISVSQILFSNLPDDHSPSSLRRSCFDEFDMIFADQGMIPLLNDDMFGDNKVPHFWLDLKNNEDWKGQIESACLSTMLCLSKGNTNTYEMKVGRISMNVQEIVENVAAVYEGIVDFLPDRWGNIGSIQLKLFESNPIAIY